MRQSRASGIAGSRQESARWEIVSIRVEGILAEVVLTTGDGHVTAIISPNAVRELRLKKGDMQLL